MTILFPSDYINKRRVDCEFQEEMLVACETEIKIALFNQSLWDTEQKLEISGEWDDTVVYRGWMMKPDEYTSFYYKLKSQGINLLTPPCSYEQLHCFPNVYNQVKEDTPKILTFPLYLHISVEGIISKLGRFLIKDFAKSAKNTDFPACFDENTSQADFNKWMDYFYTIRGNLLTGGITAKQYVKLKKYDNCTNEYRAFYMNGQLLTLSKNSNQPLYTPEVPRELVLKYTELPSPFYTVDYAEKEDGQWIVIETGDGGVSGLSSGQDCKAFYRAMSAVFKKEYEHNDYEK